MIPRDPGKGQVMIDLPAEVLGLACRLYLEEAYPQGPATIPSVLRAYWDIPADADVDDLLEPSPQTRGHCQKVLGPRPGYQLRLGCVGFQHLKLTLQGMPSDGQMTWLFSVDTHDSWHHPANPDRAAWLELQAANRAIKARIERAWENAGLLTLNRLLREELARAR